MARSKYERSLNIRAARQDIPLSRIAEKIGITEFTLRNWIARDLRYERYYQIIRAIEEIKEENQ